MLWDLYRISNRYINTLDKQEWLLILCGVVVVGVFCLRGFGSRAGY